MCEVIQLVTIESISCSLANCGADNLQRMVMYRVTADNFVIVIVLMWRVRTEFYDKTVKSYYCSSLTYFKWMQHCSQFFASLFTVTVTALLSILVAVWLNGNNVGLINKVTLHRAGLVLRWVTVHGYTMSIFNRANSVWSFVLG